ncbi:MAG: hypothetical protein E6Q40_16560 [Cupriavidus sp.]|nr:MAG: hypothetical protein E6Q40_16560 [Cupriavidus sp.]
MRNPCEPLASLGEKSKTAPGRNSRRKITAFTLLEMLVACAVLAMLSALLLTTLGQTTSITRRATEGISAFQAARAAFDIMTTNLGQATLSSYWDYQDDGGDFRTASSRASFKPAAYGRNSELHFLIQPAGTQGLGTTGTGEMVAFQFPTAFASSASHEGLSSLLSACGYYVEYGDIEPLPSPFPQTAHKYRFRLMQALLPAENLKVYDSSTGNAWLSDLSSYATPIADNVIYLLVWPRKTQAEDNAGDELSSNFTYDSRKNARTIPQPQTANQLPPTLQVSIVCIDESSASRFCTGETPPAAISSAFTGLFANSTQAQVETDLDQLGTRLGSLGVNFRILTTIVPLRESKMQ